MTGDIRAKIFDSEEIVTVTYDEPIAAARKFKGLSDLVWNDDNNQRKLNCFSVASRLPATEVRDGFNEISADIDDRFLISGVGKALDLGSPYSGSPPVVISAEELDTPTSAGVQTFNWDSRMTFGYVEVDGEQTAVEFLDGHTDYYRELSAKLRFGKHAVASYVMQRSQPEQGHATNLSLNVWHLDFAETGYEGHQLVYAAISEDQELRLLDLMQRMVGE